jgi:hypothetical protein
MRVYLRIWAILTLALVVCFIVARTANARADADCGYSLSQVYGAAIRYLRVDLGYDVTEKDSDAAYLLFRYRVPGDPKREVSGSIEMVKLDRKVRIFVKVPQMPQLHEQLLRDGLLKKLSQEYGEPTRSPSEKPKAPQPDAGADGNPR